MNDVIRLVCERAARIFGGTDGMFNGANFAQSLSKMSESPEFMDGRLVRLILCGRSDVEISGGSHYRLIAKTRCWK